MRRLIFSSLIIAANVALPAHATEYIYRDVMANTLPGAKCDSNAKASEASVKPYTIDRFSKKFCQSQGYGWHLDQVVDNGKTICSECSNQKGLEKCHQEDMTVTCKRIKPGTVGMLPGEG